MDGRQVTEVPRPSLPGRQLSIAATMRRDVPGALFGAFGLALLIGIWWLVSLYLDPLRLPDPWTVLLSIRQNWVAIPAMQYIAMQAGGISDALGYTVGSVLLTVALGGIAGTLVGIAVWHVAPLRSVLTPALMVLGSTPILILLPFLVQWFGTGRLVRSGLVIIFTFVVIVTVCMRSAVQAAGQYQDYARSLGAGPRFEITDVVLPALVPDLVSGLRLSLASAWSLQTVAELISGQHGVGRIIGIMANLANTTVLLAMVVSLGTVAVVLDGILVLLANRIIPWRT